MKKLLAFLLALSACAAFGKGRIQDADVKTLSELQSAVLTTTGNLTISNACISSPGSTTGLAVGHYIYDTTSPTKIPNGTTIAGLPGTCSSGQIQMSQNATASATGDTITFGGTKSQLINDSKIYVTGGGINDQLSTAITTGRIGGGGAGGINLLQGKNETFEAGDPPTNWTASGGSFAAQTSGSGLLFGSQSGAFDASAASQTLSSDAVAIPNGLKGGNGAFYCYVQTAATDYKLQATDGTNVLSEITIEATTNAQRQGRTFIFPLSGNVQLKVLSASNAAVVYLDQCYIGSPDPYFGNVSQAEMYGTIRWQGATNCSWQNTGSGMIDFSADADCDDISRTLYGKATPESSNPGQLPQIHFNSLPPGYYRVVATGQFRTYGNSSDYVQSGWRFSVNSNEYTSAPMYIQNGGPVQVRIVSETVLEGFFYIPNGLGESVIKLQSWKAEANYTAVDNNDGGRNLSISVYRFPLSSDQAVTPDAQIDYTGSITAWATDCPTGTITANGKSIGKSSGDFQGANYWRLYEKIWSLPGVSTTAGHAFVISSAKGGSASADWDAGKTITIDFATNELFIRQDGSVTTFGGYQADEFKSHTHTEQGVQGGVDIASGSGVTGLDRTSGATGGLETRPKNVALNYCVNWSGVRPAPILTNMVSTSASGGVRVEAAKITYSGGVPTATEISGDWISTVGDTATGIATLNLNSGIFSAEPSCTITMTNNPVSAFPRQCSVTSASSSAIIINCAYFDSGAVGTAIDVNYYINCIDHR